LPVHACDSRVQQEEGTMTVIHDRSDLGSADRRALLGVQHALHPVFNQARVHQALAVLTRFGVLSTFGTVDLGADESGQQSRNGAHAHAYLRRYRARGFACTVSTTTSEIVILARKS
jgi:hypothetical protein